MENIEAENSIPYIDDCTDNELSTSYSPYNLRIIENYQNKNRNIEITSQVSEDVTGKSLSPVAPLAEESDLNDRLSDSQEEGNSHIKFKPQQTGLKLIIKGWNSTIRIEGLDHKSSIMLKGKTERFQQEKLMGSSHKKQNNSIQKVDGSKPPEKIKKGRWKMLTKSLISKSARFERRETEERYPKYVLLRDEEELEKKIEEKYPKMVVFNERRLKKLLTTDFRNQQKNLNNAKPEFKFKKSFKNKTKPLVSMDELLSKDEKINYDSEKSKDGIKKYKKPQTDRSERDKNIVVREKVIVESIEIEKVDSQPQKNCENEPKVLFSVTSCSPTQSQVFNDIQGIVEDTLKLSPSLNPTMSECLSQVDDNEGQYCSQAQPEEICGSTLPQFCQFSCHDPSCCANALNQPPAYIPVYNPYTGLPHVYKNSNVQPSENDFCVPPHFMKLNKEENGTSDRDVDLQGLPFGILSSFFPRVVIMKTLHTDTKGLDNEIHEVPAENKKSSLPLSSEVEKKRMEEVQARETLQVPLPDLTLKSKMSLEKDKTEPKTPELISNDVYNAINSLNLNEIPSSDDEQKTNTDGSEATEYLKIHDNEFPEIKLEKPPLSWKKDGKSEATETKAEDEKPENDESLKNLSLTKVGYKMYDNLTKLSLNREKDVIEKPEGCGCSGNGTKKSPYNITLEADTKIIKFSVPEDELNFQIMNSAGSEIQIGVSSKDVDASEEDKPEGKKIVKKNELWHPENGGKVLRSLVLKNENLKDTNDLSKDYQRIKLTVGNNKEMILSIEMNSAEKEREKTETKEKATREMKVGTDDYLAGGDFVSTIETNCKNLSPRTGQILKNLQEKLEFGERERKALAERINKTLKERISMVKQDGPGSRDTVSSKVFPLPNSKKIPESERQSHLREYYCEECLATMRIFEDANPSVKSMVNKFETIIQLESY